MAKNTLGVFPWKYIMLGAFLLAGCPDANAAEGSGLRIRSRRPASRQQAKTTEDTETSGQNQDLWPMRGGGAQQPLPLAEERFDNLHGDTAAGGALMPVDAGFNPASSPYVLSGGDIVPSPLAYDPPVEQARYQAPEPPKTVPPANRKGLRIRRSRHRQQEIQESEQPAAALSATAAVEASYPGAPYPYMEPWQDDGSLNSPNNPNYDPNLIVPQFDPSAAPSPAGEPLPPLRQEQLNASEAYELPPPARPNPQGDKAQQHPGRGPDAGPFYDKYHNIIADPTDYQEAKSPNNSNLPDKSEPDRGWGDSGTADWLTGGVAGAFEDGGANGNSGNNGNSGSSGNDSELRNDKAPAADRAPVTPVAPVAPVAPANGNGSENGQAARRDNNGGNNPRNGAVTRNGQAEADFDADPFAGNDLLSDEEAAEPPRPRGRPRSAADERLERQRLADRAERMRRLEQLERMEQMERLERLRRLEELDRLEQLERMQRLNEMERTGGAGEGPEDGAAASRQLSGQDDGNAGSGSGSGSAAGRRQPAPPTPEEVETYRQRLELRLLERYNNLPDHAGNVGRVEVVLSKPIEKSLDGGKLRAEFDQLVYDPWGRRIPALEEEYFVVTFAAGGAQQVRTDPSVRVGLDHEQGFSEKAPLPADPFANVPESKVFAPAPAPASASSEGKPGKQEKRMADWWRPSFPELE